MIKKGWLLFLAVVLTAGFVGTSYAEVTMSGQVRARAEYRVNNDWNDAADDENAWVEQRTRVRREDLRRRFGEGNPPGLEDMG